MAPPFARATFYPRHDPRSTFAEMVGATKKPRLEWNDLTPNAAFAALAK